MRGRTVSLARQTARYLFRCPGSQPNGTIFVRRSRKCVLSRRRSSAVPPRSARQTPSDRRRTTTPAIEAGSSRGGRSPQVAQVTASASGRPGGRPRCCPVRHRGRSRSRSHRVRRARSAVRLPRSSPGAVQVVIECVVRAEDLHPVAVGDVDVAASVGARHRWAGRTARARSLEPNDHRNVPSGPHAWIRLLPVSAAYSVPSGSTKTEPALSTGRHPSHGCRPWSASSPRG